MKMEKVIAGVALVFLKLNVNAIKFVKFGKLWTCKYLFLIAAIHDYVHRRRTCLVSVQGSLVKGD